MKGTTAIVQVQHATPLDARLEVWARANAFTERLYADRARELVDLFRAWEDEARPGPFFEHVARLRGRSPATIWRQYRAGLALRAGVAEADQVDLLQAAELLEGDVPVEQINAAIQEGTIRALVLALRARAPRPASDTVKLVEAVRGRFETLGLTDLRRRDRDALLYHVFLLVDEETIESIARVYRAHTVSKG